VLVLYWYNKDYPWNVKFDQRFQVSLRANPSMTIEYYSEYLESNRFPGESQMQVFRDYLINKYSNHPIDIVVAASDAALDFLLKYRTDLFPRSAIVFIASRYPTDEETVNDPGLTGIVNLSAHAKTVELARRLHPDTQQIYVINGTLEHDRRLETLARRELTGVSGADVTYLTDLPLQNLISTVKNLPEHSIVLYVWQQSQNAEEPVLESADIFGSIVPSTKVPIYGLTLPLIGAGSVGGYINTADDSGAKVAQIVVQIANGVRAKDIAIEPAPAVPIFDWRQLQRWKIAESNLPAGSIVEFRQLSFWQQYKFRIIAAMTIFLLQAVLIAGLLIERRRERQGRKKILEGEQQLQQLTGRLIQLQDEERRRIAAELHDGLGQSLVIIKNRAMICLRDTAAVERVTAQLAEISSTASSAIDEVHGIAYNLRPYELDRLGLVKSIEAMVSKLSNSSSIEFSTDIDPVDGLLSRAGETSIYRIIQEGLNNVVKHAEATKVNVKVKQSHRELVICVSDNGKGITKPAGEEVNGHGFGLAGIAERARMLGGHSAIESLPGHGTRMTVNLRLQDLRPQT